MKNPVNLTKLPPKPPWIRVRLPRGPGYQRILELKREQRLHTVCEAALCPNRADCWERGTATFLILGDHCTRRCRFCAVPGGPPLALAECRAEPRRVAAAVAAMELRHVVVTSVTRDDLEDGGAGIFAATIQAIRAAAPGCSVEVLIPDFQGDRRALERVLAAAPEILGHNLETVAALYPKVRPQARYRRSLELLRRAKESAPSVITKSGLMLGLGESHSELIQALQDLREVDCDILTLGQYLRPHPSQLPVVRYVPPAAFESLKREALALGFRWVEAGPLVRSSYRAERQARALAAGQERPDAEVLPRLAT